MLDVLHIYDLAIFHKLDIIPVWSRRTDARILRADAASKGWDSDEWLVPDDIYALVIKFFGPPSIDLFASYGNAKTSRYLSLIHI